MESSKASSSSVPPPYVLCEVVGNHTNMCPKLDELKGLLHAPKVLVNPPPPTRENTTLARNKALHINHACAICTKYGHYTHHFPKIPRYQNALGALTQANTMTKSLASIAMIDDRYKTILYVMREEASCSYQSYSHPTSHHT